MAGRCAGQSVKVRLEPALSLAYKPIVSEEMPPENPLEMPVVYLKASTPNVASSWHGSNARLLAIFCFCGRSVMRIGVTYGQLGTFQ